MGMVDISLDDVGSLFTRAREAITGKKILDPAEMAEIDLKLKQLEQASRDGQLSINKIEAAHKSIFVAGWRPFIGWTAGVAIAYVFVVQPIVWWLIKLIIVLGNIALTKEEMIIIEPVMLDVGQLMSLVIAMLGMAGLRTYEKQKGVSREK